jgi:hypothetical protein
LYNEWKKLGVGNKKMKKIAKYSFISVLLSCTFILVLFQKVQADREFNTPVQSSVTPTATAAIVDEEIFRDDFTKELQPGWTWENEDKTKWEITDDGFLEIKGGHDSLITHNQQVNLLWHELPDEDFSVSVHLATDPRENFQQAAIFLYEDPQNYVTINRGYCGPCGGSGFYMDYKIGGSKGTYRVSSTKTDVYLKLESKDKIISGFYATQPDKWIRLGRFGNFFSFKKVGLGVTNGADTKVKILGKYDWFEILKSK